MKWCISALRRKHAPNFSVFIFHIHEINSPSLFIGRKYLSAQLKSVFAMKHSAHIKRTLVRNDIKKTPSRILQYMIISNKSRRTQTNETNFRGLLHNWMDANARKITSKFICCLYGAEIFGLRTFVLFTSRQIFSTFSRNANLFALYFLMTFAYEVLI